ncbi:odorant receptor 131-2-like [Corythoichthys intestinalis]|uniref:odorant receptor 131-2-like n=1 Tax=Corythoichthys intestinalis TaxID=161448 RepID=UPI0025A4E578|nr:odorant receptor 131-2-like [Corythoichthys intestinalis]
MQHLLVANMTAGLSLMEHLVTATMTISSCLMFLFVNGVMLFTLRSKPVFREMPRYILLFHLLLGDTLQLAFSLLLYLLSASLITVTYPLCGVLVMLGNLVSRVSALVLVVMSLERYVAVCHPLRHTSITTVRNMNVAVLAVWLFCFVNVLIQGLLLIEFPFDQLESLQMTQRCTFHAILLVPVLEHYYDVYTYFVFILAGLSIIFSYLGVIMVAKSAATDKDSTHKARNTLLLHLVQLGLSLLSVPFAIILTKFSTLLNRLVFSRVRSSLFVCFYLLPRSLSGLVYGLRDQNLRVVFVYHFCCHLKVSVNAVIEPQEPLSVILPGTHSNLIRCHAFNTKKHTCAQ